MRDIETEAWKKGNQRANLALNMYFTRIKRFIGAFSAEIGGIDLLIFTGGVGENGPETREIVSRDLEYMGIQFDKKVNEGVRGKFTVLSTPESKVKVVLVPTNEELVIASETARLIS